MTLEGPRCCMKATLSIETWPREKSVKHQTQSTDLLGEGFGDSLGAVVTSRIHQERQSPIDFQ